MLRFIWFDKLTEVASEFGRFNYQELSWLRKIKMNQSRIKKILFPIDDAEKPLRKSLEILYVSLDGRKVYQVICKQKITSLNIA